MNSRQTTKPGSGLIGNDVELRDIVDSDLDFFFEHQLDPEASRLIGFASRDRAEFDAHWAKVLTDEGNINQTIVTGGKVAGNIACFIQSGEREVGYWLGREYWGKGIGTRALSEFLVRVRERPIFAHVAKHNYASVRVLEKCGFVPVGEDKMLSEVTSEVIEEWVMKLG
jgi:RimJ/RimL family protein N-acetyltransferase